MNRGTALKWAERLETTAAVYDNSQLAFKVDDVEYKSPLGVLADFLDPEGWEKHPILGYQWHGEVFKIPEQWAKKAKLKLDSFAIYEQFDQAIGSLNGHNERAYGHLYAARFAQTNYERL